jgi:hypothetical protein
MRGRESCPIEHRSGAGLLGVSIQTATGQERVRKCDVKAE